jgi:mannose-6-phosphate isomerase-like protein (cupin superfamily)
MKRASILALSALLGCHTSSLAANAPRGHLIAPSSQTSEVRWSAAEQGSPLAIRNLRQSAEASFHLLRVVGAQRSQLHKRSDLVLMAMAGSPSVTVGTRRLQLTPGDVVEIPRGTAYSLENAGPAAGILYAVHTPPRAPEDQLAAPETTREDAWQWNVWVQ